MYRLLHNIRFYILTLSCISGAIVYVTSAHIQPDSSRKVALLTQIYGFISISFLYITLLASPLKSLIGSNRFIVLYIKARRSLGVSSFLFALLHTLFALFGELGGIQGFIFLSRNYYLSLSLGLVGMLILTILASTSFDTLIKKLSSKKWKLLHKLIYIGGICILLHTILIGSHFVIFFSSIAQIAYGLLGVFFTLEALRIDKFLAKKYPKTENYSPVFYSTLILIGIYIFYILLT